jgi:hypothetical protein
MTAASYAIFNSFPFHYEMFGYIIDYLANSNNIDKPIVDIYTETELNMGWIHFYEIKFPGMFRIIPYTEFSVNNEYQFVFLATDDDPRFSNEWFNAKTICIDHYYLDRRPAAGIRRLGIRPFERVGSDWSYPVYRLVSAEEKGISLIKGQVVCLGRNCPISMESLQLLMERVSFIENVTVICIGRYLHNVLFHQTIYPNVSFKVMTDTSEMIEDLIKSEFVYISDVNTDHIYGLSMSASVPLAINSLCKCIIPLDMYNTINCSNIKSAITYSNDNNNANAFSLTDLDNELQQQIIQKTSTFDKILYMT